MATDIRKYVSGKIKKYLSYKYEEVKIDGRNVFKFYKGKKVELEISRESVEDTLNRFVRTLIDNCKDHNDIIVLLLVGARINCKFGTDIDKEIIECIESIKRQKYLYFLREIIEIFYGDVFEKENVAKNILNCYMEFETWPEKEALHVIIKYVGEKTFFINKNDFLQRVITSEYIINGLLEQNFINAEDVKKCINNLSEEYDKFKKFKKGVLFWLKYINPEIIINLFSDGLIDQKSLQKYVSVEDLISRDLDPKLIIKFFDKKVFDTEECEWFLWDLCKSKYFADNDIDVLIKRGYLNPNHIIDMYNKNQSRSIAVALEEIPEISQSDLAMFLSPQRILNLENSNKPALYNEQSRQFVRTELRTIYCAIGENLELALLDEQKQRNKMQEESKQKPLIYLYKAGLVSLSKFGKEDISKEEIKKYYEENNNPQILIEANNNGTISNSDLLGMIENFDDIFNLIENGLNPVILNEFCSVQDILDLYKDGKVSFENLQKLTIDAEKVKVLYISEKIGYEDLQILCYIGLITIDERKQIEEEYDIEAKLMELRKRGILGKDKFELGDDEYIKPDSSSEGSIRQSLGLKEKTILSDAKQEFFKKLGASEPVYVKCYLFKDYIMYPIIDKRLAIFEGEKGATYIFPLKVVLEQVGKELSFIKEHNIIGRAKTRKQVYTERKLVQRVYHTASWPINVIKGMTMLNPALDEAQIKNDCGDIIKDIVDYYELCIGDVYYPNELQN